MRRHEGTTQAGFTLIELLVSIAIIALLITLIAVGVAHASKIARGASERQTVVQLNQAVQAFKQEFGFLPPLVNHSSTVKPVQVLNTNPKRAVPNAYGGLVPGGATSSFNSNAGFLEGFQSAGSPSFSGTKKMSADWAAGTSGSGVTAPDLRFSEYSLAYYLVGALPKSIDGVDGPGMFKPKVDGSFEFASYSVSGRVKDDSGKSYPPFVDTSRRSPRIETDFDASTADGISWANSETGVSVTNAQTRMTLVGPNGKAYRYYRWSPRQVVGVQSGYYNTVTGAFDRVEDDIDRLDVPSLLGDPRDDPSLRAAEYAIVSAGPDGFFGDMNLEATSPELLGDMAKAFRIGIDDTNVDGTSFKVRKAARADNLVEVGR